MRKAADLVACSWRYSTVLLVSSTDISLSLGVSVDVPRARKEAGNQRVLWVEPRAPWNRTLARRKSGGRNLSQDKLMIH